MKKTTSQKTWSNRILLFAFILILLAGVTLLFYFPVQQYLYMLKAHDIIEEYHQRTKRYPEDDLEYLYQTIVAYNKSLYECKQDKLVDAFAFEQVDFSLLQFGFDEEIIGSIEIPEMKVNLPIYLGANTHNLENGAAHLTQTTIPVGGNNTNAVIAAHRGFRNAAMFRDIEHLNIGDRVYIINFRETLEYAVCEVAVIKPTEIEKILIQDDRDLVTLITCHPYRHNYQRYVVYCERV